MVSLQKARLCSAKAQMDFRSNGGTHVALLCVFLKHLHPLTEKVADGYHIHISKEPFSAVNPKHHTVKWPSNVSVFILGKLCNLLSQQIFDVCAAFQHPPFPSKVIFLHICCSFKSKYSLPCYTDEPSHLTFFVFRFYWTEKQIDVTSFTYSLFLYLIYLPAHLTFTRPSDISF